jgi:glycosidase
MNHWSFDSVFYHIYPLGLSGAPPLNDLCSAPVSRLRDLTPWLEHIHEMGINALYIGPLFESMSHGYDTVDYFTLDRRLGTNSDLKSFVDACHSLGIRVLFDAVFHHVGRDHFSFRDLQKNGWDSPYRDWFYTDFSSHSPSGDPFRYEGWNGHLNLVKLNLKNDAVKKYLFDAVAVWMDSFGADGLRLDAADSIDKNFFNALRSFCSSKRSDFWLLGEVIHGNYREWVSPERLDSVTNYECFKGLWSSLNDGNFFEIAYTLNRQFGTGGLYKNLPLYNFADNHDVDRAATILKNSAHLFPLYILLFTIPGVPSIYYGSEWGIPGKKGKTSDADLRPALDLSFFRPSKTQNDLFETIVRLILLRKDLTALRCGAYRPLHTDSRQYAFVRETDRQKTVVAVNSAQEIVTIEPKVDFPEGTIFIDRLNKNERFSVQNGKLKLLLYPNWGRILQN